MVFFRAKLGVLMKFLGRFHPGHLEFCVTRTRTAVGGFFLDRDVF